MEYIIVNGELYHHGIKGQKWGRRRWQNADGTYNEAGKARYFGRSAGGNVRRTLAKVYDINERFYSKRGNSTMASMNRAAKERQLKKATDLDKAKAEKIAAKNTPEAKANRAKTAKKAAIIGASVVAAGLAAYGGYKLYSSNQANKALKSMISDEQARKRREEGEQALKRMYDKMAVDAMKNGASYYSFADNKIGYRIELGKPKK